MEILSISLTFLVILEAFVKGQHFGSFCDCDTTDKMDPHIFFGLEVLQFEDNAANRQRQRKPRVYTAREDPRETMSDFEFRKHFRFSKDNVGHITDMLGDELSFDTNRGLPIAPILQVCIALNHMAGGQFQRTSAWCAGVSQNGARLSLIRVTEALIRRKSEFIYMPDVDTMQDTAQRMFEKYKLPRFAFAVDGVQMRFPDAPRNIPANKTQQMFWCRKQFYALNCQGVGNDKYLYDLELGWPGSTHDSRIWNRSMVKRIVEEQRRFLIAGDSGYPISENLVKPYPTNESSRDRRKRLFNRRHSGLRTTMSECLFGPWKRHFPILKNLRTDFELSQKIILATGILFNMARMWDDDDFDDEDANEDDDDDALANGVVIQDQAQATVRRRGQCLRDQLKDAMPN